MSIKNDLKYSITILLKRNNEGSYSTQATRRQILARFANDLVKLGYGLRDIRNLKRKHIDAVVQSWQQNKLSPSTLKNRMSVLRFYAKKLINATLSLLMMI